MDEFRAKKSKEDKEALKKEKKAKKKQNQKAIHAKEQLAKKDVYENSGMQQSTGKKKIRET